jgi:hypothetical protein
MVIAWVKATPWVGRDGGGRQVGGQQDALLDILYGDSPVGCSLWWCRRI